MGPVLCGFGAAAGARPRRRRHQRHQAPAHDGVHAVLDARRQHASRRGRRGRQGPRPGLCHGLVLRLGGAAQPVDSQFQRRLVRRRGEPEALGDLRAAQAGRPVQPQGGQQEPTALLGPAALHGRADVYGRHHGLPLRTGPVRLQGQGAMVARGGHGTGRAARPGQPLHGLHEVLLQRSAALQQVPHGVDGAGGAPVHPADAGFPGAGPHRPAAGRGAVLPAEGLDRCCHHGRLLPALRAAARHRRHLQRERGRRPARRARGRARGGPPASAGRGRAALAAADRRLIRVALVGDLRPQGRAEDLRHAAPDGAGAPADGRAAGLLPDPARPRHRGQALPGRGRLRLAARLPEPVQQAAGG